jgi:hypothetical protein
MPIRASLCANDWRWYGYVRKKNELFGLHSRPIYMKPYELGRVATRSGCEVGRQDRGIEVIGGERFSNGKEVYRWKVCGWKVDEKNISSLANQIAHLDLHKVHAETYKRI